VIAWQNPGALVALVALVAPLVVHLLQKRRAARVPFPSDRFVRPSVTGAVRLRLPSDLALLMLRLAIVAMAVCAWAQPVIVSRERMRAWNARVSRAVVVDVSDSMRRAAAAAASAADVELRSASHAFRIESADLIGGLHRAAAGLADAPPARREIVVISDFQRGMLEARALAGLHASVGIRFVRVGDPVNVRHASGPPLLARDGRAQRADITVQRDRTSVAFVEVAPQQDGLQLAGATDVQRDVLLSAVASTGAPAPSPEQPLVVAFGRPEGSNAGRAKRFEQPWMLETALRLRRDPDLAGAAADSPSLRFEASADALVVDVSADPDSFVAAAAVRGVLSAQQGSPASTYAEDEVLAMTDEELRAWSRHAPDVAPDVWRHARQSDARWVWAIVLLLLGAETLVRARGLP
jgi:hypothetical protein